MEKTNRVYAKKAAGINWYIWRDEDRWAVSYSKNLNKDRWSEVFDTIEQAREAIDCYEQILIDTGTAYNSQKNSKDERENTMSNNNDEIISVENFFKNPKSYKLHGYVRSFMALHNIGSEDDAMNILDNTYLPEDFGLGEVDFDKIWSEMSEIINK